MSRAEVSVLIAFCVMIPFAGAVLLALAGGTPRMRKACALLYAAVSVGFNLAFLSGYMQHPSRAAWGSLRFASMSFPAFFILNMLAVAAVLYASFRETSAERPALLTATIPLACGFGALALVVSTLTPQVFLWLGASGAALLGLIAHGATGALKRMRAFIPWLVSDLLFVLGAILCSLLLKDSSVLIKPPLTAGSEAQVIVVAALFLVSALVRLGVFPFHGWIADLISRTDSSWSSFFLGSLNFVLAGMRLVVAVTLLARLVATDWGLGLAIAALVSVVAGPLLAMRSESVQGSIAGLYCMQSGFLLFSLAMYSRAGIEGALFILLTVPLFMTAFLMASGTAATLRGSKLLGRQQLAARSAPAAFVVMLVSGLALAGIPAMDGFVGKAYVVLAGLDKANVSQFYALGAAAGTAALALGLVAVVRTIGGSFGAESTSVSAKPGLLEGLVPLSICAFCALLGLFPGLLFRNFIDASSKALYAPGFQGPAIVFRGTGDSVGSVLRAYPSWAPIVAAFFLAAAVLVLVSYFASRAAHPSAGAVERSAPFMGGAPGIYNSAWSSPLKMRQWNVKRMRNSARRGKVRGRA